MDILCEKITQQNAHNFGYKIRIMYSPGVISGLENVVFVGAT